MTMLRWNLAGLVILAGAASASAGDTIRLGGPATDAATMRLGGSAESNGDLFAAAAHSSGHHGGGHGSFHHSGGHGSFHHGGFNHGSFHHGGFNHGSFHHGFHHGSFYHHNRFWGGYYWPYLYSAFAYRPYWYSSFYYPAYYYAPYASYPSYYYSYPAAVYVAPCAADATVAPEFVTLGGTAISPIQGAPITPQIRNGNGAYRYDGGPREAIPMPSRESAPAVTPPAPPEPKLKLVTLSGNTQYTYRAYGETNQTTAPASDTRLVSTKTAPVVRLSYPAFGDVR
jgi:hypothetical protein